MVVESPDSLASRRLQSEPSLRLSDHVQVLPKELLDDDSIILNLQQLEGVQNGKKGKEGELVACSVVDPGRVAERVDEMVRDFREMDGE